MRVRETYRVDETGREILGTRRRLRAGEHSGICNYCNRGPEWMGSVAGHPFCLSCLEMHRARCGVNDDPPFPRAE